MEWIALGSLGVLLCANLAGGVVGVVKLTNCLNDRFADLKEAQAETLKAHEKEDERRHIENIERFAALESVLNGSHPRPRRRLTAQ